MVSKKGAPVSVKKDPILNRKRARLYRLDRFRNRVPQISARWWVRIIESAVVIGLMVVNFILILPFFGAEDRANVFSAPLIPLLSEITEPLIPFTYGIRIWLLTFIAFFPLTFYYFVRDISGRRLVGMLASLISLLPIGVFLSYRIDMGLLAGDGSHIAALTVIPLASLALLRFLRFGNFWYGMLASGLGAVVALTSPAGFLALAVFMTIITFSEMLLGEGRLKIFRFLLISLMIIGFSSFWYSPHYVASIFQSPQGQIIRKTFSNLLPISFFTVPILAIFGFLLFENRSHLQPLFVAIFLTVALGLFSMGAGVAHAEPSRFLPAFGIAFSFFMGMLLVMTFDFFRFSSKLKRFRFFTVKAVREKAAFGFLGLIVIVLVLVTILSVDNLWQLEGHQQVLGLSSEQKVGVWQVKQQTSTAQDIPGYIITGLTVAGMVALKIALGI
jgi:hypothetical protein